MENPIIKRLRARAEDRDTHMQTMSEAEARIVKVVLHAVADAMHERSVAKERKAPKAADAKEADAT